MQLCLSPLSHSLRAELLGVCSFSLPCLTASLTCVGRDSALVTPQPDRGPGTQRGGREVLTEQGAVWLGLFPARRPLCLRDSKQRSQPRSPGYNRVFRLSRNTQLSCLTWEMPLGCWREHLAVQG